MIDPKKQYRTRDGREVRIYAVDGKGPSSVIHGAVNAGDGWVPFSWFEDGRYRYGQDGTDLIEVKPRIKTKAWLNVYRHEDGFEFNEVWESKHAADSARGDACIACVEIDIDVEEGHGL